MAVYQAWHFFTFFVEIDFCYCFQRILASQHLCVDEDALNDYHCKVKASNRNFSESMLTKLTLTFDKLSCVMLWKSR